MQHDQQTVSTKFNSPELTGQYPDQHFHQDPDLQKARTPLDTRLKNYKDLSRVLFGGLVEHKLSTLVSEGSQGSLNKAGQAQQRTVKIVDVDMDGTGTGTRKSFGAQVVITNS